ncbi:KTSC domain-containing protein [Rhodoblastus acidophilus]|uniref:KTSC domain-containing protein n=1 Tax=Rhodoblastus acidophilus TaxID=1074 RepID=A0A6N8DLN8_RHOAC|nr:KTSC domain-containing protein [Rhodoblastus acidophilus]MCW2275130.1 hypothetical protein [Rhodoblastus acidophilus]MTV31399.1 KTSC domain-containing protein [Rhodoblastus acidophilus]
MHMKPVKSSMISQVGYDAAKKVLHVHFPSGAQYEYHEVEPETHLALISAKSIGQHFIKHVRGVFKHRQIEATK